MKKGTKLLLLVLIIFIPIVIFAELSNYDVTIGRVNNYITSEKYTDRNKYLLIRGDLPFQYDNNGLKPNSSFYNGGLLNKKEYDLSIRNENSYLATGLEYWTMTSLNSSDNYYIENYILTKPKSNESGVRVTEFVKKDTKVSGSGSYVNPWVFDGTPLITIRTNSLTYGSIDTEGNSVSSKQAEKIMSGSVIVRYTGSFELLPKTGFKYLGHDGCGLVKENSDINSNSFRIMNVSNDLDCTANFGPRTYELVLYNSGYVVEPLPRSIFYKYLTGWYKNADLSSSFITLDRIPQKTGYSFDGYYYGTNEIIKANGTLNTALGNNTTIFNDLPTHQDQIALEEKWKSNVYEITLDPSPGSGGTTTIYEKYNTGYYLNSGAVASSMMTTSANAITRPTRVGYSFGGYYTQPNGGGTKVIEANGYLASGVSTTVFSETGRLYAKWNTDAYSITYNTNYGANNSFNPSSYTIETDTFNLNAPTKTLTFKGNPNSTSGANAASGTVSISGNTTREQTFKGWTGSNGTTPQTSVSIPKGSTGNKTYTANWTSVAGNLPTVTRSGYTCGWSNSSSGTTIKYTSGGQYPASDITQEMNSTVNLYAVCTRNNYTITYTMNNGTNNSSNPTTYHVETNAITLAAPSKTLTFKGNANSTSGANAASGTVTIGSNTTKAQTFKGWTGSNGTTAQTSVTIPKGSTGNKTYTANWIAVAGTLPTVTRSGYTCGWNTSSSGTTIQYSSGGQFPTSAITQEMGTTVNLYAVCTRNSYTISYTMNNGTNNSSNPTTYNVDSNAITLAAPSKTLTFKGNANSTAAANAASGTVTIGSNTTKAQTFKGWTGSNGTTAQTSVTIPKGSTGNKSYTAGWTAVAGTLPTVTRSGYTCGWNTSSTGTTIQYNSGGTFPTSAITEGMGTTVNLYAVCTRSNYTIAYTMNNGTNNSSNPTSYNVDSNAITLAAPTKTLTFKGNPNSTAAANAASGTVTIGSNTTKAQTFRGWTGSNGTTAQTSVTIPKGSTGNKTYTAGWTAVAATLPTVTRSGYICGWNTSSTGTTIQYNSGGSFPTSAITEGMATTVNLYAVCRVASYTISYTMNNGTNNSSNPTSYTDQTDTITLRAPTKTLTFKGNANSTAAANAASGTVSIGSNTTKAQTFKGWTGSNGTTAQTSVTIPKGSTGDKTYTANWTAVAGTLPTVTKSGYTCGWNTSSSGTTIQYSSGGTFPTSAITQGMGTTVNLYAVCVIEDPTTTAGSNLGTLEQCDRDRQGFYHAGWGDGGAQTNTVAAANAGDDDGIQIPRSKVTVCEMGKSCVGGGTIPTCWVDPKKSAKTVCNYYGAEKICSHYGWYVLPYEARLNMNLCTAAENSDAELDYTIRPGVGYAYTLNLCSDVHIVSEGFWGDEELIGYCPTTNTCYGALNNQCKPGYYWGHNGKGGYFRSGYDNHPVFRGITSSYDKQSAFSVRCVDYNSWDNPKNP